MTDDEIVAHEWGLQPGPMKLSVPIGPVFTGGYFRAEADLGGLGLTPPDVDFTVEEGADGGYVSAGVEPPGLDGLWPIVVGAGHLPGEYHLIARRKADGQELARRRFRITGHWPDDQRGPKIAVTGESPVMVPLAWGDGAEGPMTFAPAPSDWRVALVLVSTRDQRYTAATSQAATTDFTDYLVGAARSARRYYGEVSFGKTTVSRVGNQVFGPIDLPGGWGDYFEARGGAWDGWRAKDNTWKECASAFSVEMRRRAIEDVGDPGFAEQILQTIDAIVFVFPTTEPTDTMPATDSQPARFTWGTAQIDDPPQVWWKNDLSTRFRRVPAITMPIKLPAGVPVPWNFPEALTHELGHTLGLRDTYDSGYPAEIMTDRAMTGFDLMDETAGVWPHFSLAHRRRLGWIEPGWIKSFNFSVDPNGGTINLHALASLSAGWTPPGSNHCAGIEVPIRGSRDYYFEYRSEQAGQLGDQKLNTFGRGATRLVLGSDVDFDPAATPARPHILLLPKDVDTEGPILIAAGEDYVETDTTDAPSNGSAHDFKVVLDNAPSGNTVQVSVHYVPAQRPQLHITPAPGRDGNWKSPDINVIGPMGRNVVVAEREHTIEVTVHNLGNLAATQTKIRVAWLPFTTSPASWNQLAAPAPQDIPAQGKVVYRVPWRVPRMTVDGVDVWHFCVRADVTAYTDPDDAHSEVVVHDNWAQSNFDRAFSLFGSPSVRRRTGVTITNTLADPATFRTAVNQSSAFFRTYIGNAWLRLEPGETHVTEFMYESLAGDPLHGSAFEQAFRKSEGLSNVASLTTSAVGPGGSCAVGHQWWGARLIIQAGYATRIEDMRLTSDGVSGTVIATMDGVDQKLSGSGDVNMVFWLTDQPDETTVAGRWSDDRFWVSPPRHIMEAAWNEKEVCGEAFFLSHAFWASCRSGAQGFFLSH